MKTAQKRDDKNYWKNEPKGQGFVFSVTTEAEPITVSIGADSATPVPVIPALTSASASWYDCFLVSLCDIRRSCHASNVNTVPFWTVSFGDGWHTDSLGRVNTE